MKKVYLTKSERSGYNQLMAQKLHHAENKRVVTCPYGEKTPCSTDCAWFDMDERHSVVICKNYTIGQLVDEPAQTAESKISENK